MISPDHRGELVAVAAARGGDDDLGHIGEAVDDEVLVGRVREDAGLQHLGRPSRVGEVSLDERAKRGLVIRPRRAAGVVRVDRFA